VRWVRLLSLNALVWVLTAIGLAGVVWILVDVVRGREPSAVALWMMLPFAALGVLLNVALGALLAWKRLRGGKQPRKEGDS
jgi:hypothetical protein